MEIEMKSSFQRTKMEKVKKLSKYYIISGIIACLFHFTAGQFTVRHFYLIHIICASMLFVGYAFLIFIHISMVVLLTPKIIKPEIMKLRMVLMFFIIISFLIFGIAYVWSVKEFKHPISSDARFQWKPDDGGYALHAVSAFAQWIMALLMLSYHCTFYFEFKMFTQNRNINIS